MMTPDESEKTIKAILAALEHLLRRVASDPRYRFLGSDLREKIDKTLYDLEFLDMK